MRIFKTRSFARFARRERISDASLRDAVRRAERGLVDGRSGGYRVLIAYRAKTRSVFLFGFAKSERENIDDDELATLRDIAKGWLEANAGALADGLIQEVEHDEEEEA